VITGIVVALPQELTTLTSKQIKKQGCTFIAENLLVACSGTGPLNAQSAAKLLVANGATRLLSWGCAAALCASLKPGDLILPDKLVEAEGLGSANSYISKDWLDDVRNSLASSVIVHTGSLAESQNIISSSKNKQQLRNLTGAVALDMESAAIARVALEHGLPFLVVRAIADPVTMDLPQAIDYSLDDQGEIHLGKLALFLVLHPLELSGLIKLGVHFKAAKKTLKSIARELEKVTGFSNALP
jgi:hopanoid-associated phosphorylase